jgi:hypothetical protein
MKSVARQKRDGEKQKSQDWLDLFYEKGRAFPSEVTEEERDESLRHLKKVTFPDELLVSCVVKWLQETQSAQFQGAPFEAEWQLAYLLRCGVIDYVYTTDGDSIILGVDKLITDIDFKKKQLVIVEKAKILCNNSTPLTQYSESSWPNIAGLLGCDYIARVPGVGAATLFNKILPFSQDDNNSTVSPSKLSIDRLLKRLKEVSKNVPHDFDERYHKSVNLYRYCPILDGNGILSPLNPLPMNANWEQLIGFDPYATLAISPSKFRDLAQFKESSFLMPAGGPLPVFPIPLYLPSENPEVCSSVPLPRFARLDFEAIPLSCMHMFYLQGFLAARFGHSFDLGRSDIESFVQRAVAFGKSVMSPEKVPKQIGEWDVTEVLAPCNEGTVWLNRLEAYNCIMNQLGAIGDSSILRFYPEGNENNRNRALELLNGGNLLLPNSLVMQRCRSTKEENMEVFLFKSICVPSMKTSVISANEDNSKEVDGYRVFIAFHAESGDVLGYPYSCCGCYDGRTFCSHLLANLLAFRQVQRYGSVERFEEIWPKSPTGTQGFPTLVEYACVQELDARNRGVEARQKKRRTI